MGVVMAKPAQSAVKRQYNNLRNQLRSLEKKEKQTYEALAALVLYVKGKKRDWKKDNFSKFKKAVLTSVGDLSICAASRPNSSEPKFNVKHYERAILCASDSTYRDMAIQAASKDLTKEAMGDLITAIRRNCRCVSRQVKETLMEFRKCQPACDSVRQVWQNVVEPIAESSS